MGDNYLHRDHKTGLRILAGDYLEEILPDDIAFQLSLKKHAEESNNNNNHNNNSDEEDDMIVDLEIFFADVNCGLIASDRKASRCVLLTLRYLAVYTHAGVLKHRIALEHIKRIEFMTTQDDSSAAVLVVLHESSPDYATSSPIVFSFLKQNFSNNNNSQNLQHSPSVTSEQRSPSTLMSGNTASSIDDATASPTSRIAELRMTIGALARLRAEQDNLDTVRERATKLQKQMADGNEELLQDEQTKMIQDAPTNVNTIIVITTENSVKLDLLLRSLAGASIERANKGEEPTVAPLEVPRVNPEDSAAAQERKAGGGDINLVETVERLCRKERELALEDAQECVSENAERVRRNACFRSSAQRQGIESVVEGLRLWMSARQNLVSVRNAHANCQSNLDEMMNELESAHGSRNDQMIQLADEAQRACDQYHNSMKQTRSEVEQIDRRIKHMEDELQHVTDSFTAAMKEKDEELQVAKQAVHRMRFDLTKGSYSRLPSIAELQVECDKLETAVAQQSARAEELHISAPDKSILKHLTLQLEDENSQLQDDILNWKKSRRTISNQLIAHKMDLANAQSRGDAATKKSTDLRRRKARAEADNSRLREGNEVLEKRVRTLQQKLRRIELEAVVVEDLKREEMMHKSMLQSLRHDIRADLLEKRRVERLMKQEQDRRSKSREDAHNRVMGLE